MTPGPEHDVVIVGASVAGCRAALTLADAGVEVLLVDRAEFPRWKPCAGGITLKAKPYLDPPLWDLVQCTMTGAYLTLGSDYETHVRTAEPLGWTVHRESFDETHLELARSRPGVETVLGVTVRDVRENADAVVVETDRGPITARAVVGADGAKSIVSRALPGHDERPMGFAYEGEARASGSRLHDDILFDFRRFPRGYGWIFPKGDHYSLGGFVYARQLPEVKRLYEEFSAENGYVECPETYRTRGHPVALGGKPRRLNSGRIVLAGEAGSLVDPLTGEGIYYALRSGHLAGLAVARLLENDVPLDGYGTAVRDEIQDHLRYGRLLADFIYARPVLSYHLLLRNDLVCRWFAEIGSGQKTYQDVVREGVLKGWLLLFHTGRGKRREVRLA